MKNKKNTRSFWVAANGRIVNVDGVSHGDFFYVSVDRIDSIRSSTKGTVYRSSLVFNSKEEAEKSLNIVKGFEVDEYRDFAVREVNCKEVNGELKQLTYYGSILDESAFRTRKEAVNARKEKLRAEAKRLAALAKEAK